MTRTCDDCIYSDGCTGDAVCCLGKVGSESYPPLPEELTGARNIADDPHLTMLFQAWCRACSLVGYRYARECRDFDDRNIRAPYPNGCRCDSCWWYEDHLCGHGHDVSGCPENRIGRTECWLPRQVMAEHRLRASRPTLEAWL